MTATNKSQQLEAKITELNQWRNEQVYDKIVYDEIDDLGQQCNDGNQKKLSTKRKSLKLIYMQQVSKRDKILGQIVPLAPEKGFDYPVASYHLTDGH